MGWTSYRAERYKNGQVDRKAECDHYFTSNINKGFYEIVKSAMVGTVYYAAITTVKRYKENTNCEVIEDIPMNERRTFAVVFLTSVNNNDYYNFSYKDMDESCGPCETKCPKSILKVLSPTDYEYAVNWRKACEEYHNAKSNPNNLNNLAVGTRIKFTRNDKVIELVKYPASYQFKRPFWVLAGEHKYMPKSRIPTNFEIVSD